MYRTASFLVAASFALTGTAQAGSVAGASDGGYRAADGDYLDVDSASDRVGVGGLDCLHPAIRGNRIVSKQCWSNGHDVSDLDIEWRIAGDAVVVGGKPYARLASSGATRTSPPGAPRAAPTRVDPTGRPWSHNGSVVMLDSETGVIAYHLPKPVLASVVEDGSVLFRGRLKPGGPVVGIAYAFKTGCPAAPYEVRGSYARDGDTLTLRGASPVRRGCEVVGYSDRSPHAVLKFTYLLDD